MQKSSLLLVSALGALLGGCVDLNWSSGPGIRGSGNLISGTRQVSQFDRVSVSGSGRLSIIQGERESLTIEAEDNLLPLIKSDVSGGLLKLGPENVNLKPTRTIRYQLQLKDLRELHLSGAMEAESQSIKTDRLQLSISGSGKIQVPKLETGNLDARVSGSGDIQLAGKVDQQVVRISGSGNYRAGECESQNTTVQVTGSGDVTVWVHRTLEAHVSGSGDIRYFGSPQVNSHVSGSGGVHSAGSK